MCIDITYKNAVSFSQKIHYNTLQYTTLLLHNQLQLPGQTSHCVEIKCQLDATDDFYCRSYCLLNMFRGTTMPIIRSSRVLYKWLLPVVFGALVFKLSVWCGAEGYVSGLRAAGVVPRNMLSKQ